MQIVASGGFDAQKIREFERMGAPVDAYGVGSSLVQGENDFTADVVGSREERCKAGGASAEPRLERVL